ncbi:MAG: twin-arginine translocation signal domain-containing protein [Pseudomonas sp.]|nr:twin-arginine translocation signal domain-containing protein [Pseudomonas sp.]
MLTRRSFLKLVGIATAASAVVPALQFGREPYVFDGDLVSYIGHHPGGFGGACSVTKVHPWDGVGFPVDVRNNCFGEHAAVVRYYDADLADMARELPGRFWRNPDHQRFPNVHTYIRMQRFGESMDEAVRHLNFVSSRVA